MHSLNCQLSEWGNIDSISTRGDINVIPQTGGYLGLFHKKVQMERSFLIFSCRWKMDTKYIEGINAGQQR